MTTGEGGGSENRKGAVAASLRNAIDPRGEDEAFNALMRFVTTTKQPLSGGGQHQWWRQMAEAVVDALDERGLIRSLAEDTFSVPCPHCSRLLVYGDSEDQSVLCGCGHRVFLDAYDCHYSVETSECECDRLQADEGGHP